MRKLAALLVALACSGPAFAADMATKMPVKATPPAPIESWTGFYLGGDVGWGWSDPKATESDTIENGNPGGPNVFFPAQISGRSSGALGGAQVGYNWQFTPTWIAGIEADWDYAHFSKSSSVTAIGHFIPGTTGQASAQMTVTDPWSIRGRLGYVVQPMWMIYATGGFAEAGVKLNGNLVSPLLGPEQAPAAVSGTRSGWVAGGGVEYRQTGSPWIVGAEYLYYRFDGTNSVGGVFVPPVGAGTCPAGQACVQYSVGSFNVQTLRLRLSYKFN